MDNDFIIALGGNPNCGKTVVFNALTGSRQRVGNWPGVTVDKKYGYFQHQGYKVKVVDLPGTYSTSVTSEAGAIDEKIACGYLLSDEADIIVNVIDGSNLERNLYLTLQLLEMNIPTILAVNMMDIVKQRGLVLDLKQLSKRLGCPVVGLVARQNKGIEALKDGILKIKEKADRSAQNAPRTSAREARLGSRLRGNDVGRFILPLPAEIDQAVRLLTQVMTIDDACHAKWLALRLLEGDHFAKTLVDQSVLKLAEREILAIEAKLGEEPDILIADARYVFVNQLARAVTQLVKTPRQTLTQWIDRIVLNRFLGIPIFFAVMYFMFLFAINIGGAFQGFFDISSTTIFVDGLAHLLTSWHFPVWLTAILASGIGKGINTTITFAPVIGGMFLFLAFLEDSGYMARAAFVMDRFMQTLGLPGKSFVPMIVGFGCNVPAVMGARTLENRRDRVLTVMMMPFMSCGARLAIFALFASAFFPQGGATIIFLLYLAGISVAVLSGLVLRRTVLPGKPAPLVMELPPYHIPRFSSLWRHMWQRLKNFLFRAGRYIIPICVLIGVLNSVTVTGKLVGGASQHSLLSAVGRLVTPLFSPLGVKKDNWPATVGLTTGILAKEVVVGTLNTLYSEQGNLTQQSASQFNFWGGLREAVESVPQNLSQLGDAFKNPVAASEAPHDMNKTAYGIMYKQFGGKKAAFAYLLFILLYFPCVSTMAAMRREVGKRWALFSVLWSTGLAYALAVMCYQWLTVVEHPALTLIWSAVLVTALITAIVSLRQYASRDQKTSPLPLAEKDGSIAAGRVFKERNLWRLRPRFLKKRDGEA
ncbi:Fe(2+) transporter permease subunit FeoB [Coxiella burnetii]|uniref:Fe(2+) transporter permease subunit FeoB n=1 Tax=Coxiella burnetii TaxID=777 RepID=UPI00050983AB|nr:Fe(2+) transporter permease subunit FeoB [Coxiella burnetii]